MHTKTAEDRMRHFEKLRGAAGLFIGFCIPVAGFYHFWFQQSLSVSLLVAALISATITIADYRGRSSHSD